MPITRKSPMQDWMSESESVMDAPGEGALRSLAKMLISEDPTTDLVNPLMTGPAAPLISIFKDKAARLAGTEAFLSKARNIGNEHFFNAADEFAARYPRVAAHMDPRIIHGEPGQYANIIPPQAGGRVKEPIPFGITEGGLDMIEKKGIDEARDTMFHEGTHAAQALGNRHMSPLYSASQHLQGYMDNPFEINARTVAKRKTVPELSGMAPPAPVHQQLREIAQPPQQSIWQRGISSLREMVGMQPDYDPRKMINMIMDKRQK